MTPGSRSGSSSARCEPDRASVPAVMIRKILPILVVVLVPVTSALLGGCDKAERWGSPWAAGSGGASAAVEPGAAPAPPSAAPAHH